MTLINKPVHPASRITCDHDFERFSTNHRTELHFWCEHCQTKVSTPKHFGTKDSSLYIPEYFRELRRKLKEKYSDL